jgi:hypothetical protein
VINEGKAFRRGLRPVAELSLGEWHRSKKNGLYVSSNETLSPL